MTTRHSTSSTTLIVMLMVTIAIALISARNSAGSDHLRKPKPSARYICAHAYHGDALPATRANILKGICVLP